MSKNSISECSIRNNDLHPLGWIREIRDGDWRVQHRKGFRLRHLRPRRGLPDGDARNGRQQHVRQADQGTGGVDPECVLPDPDGEGVPDPTPKDGCLFDPWIRDPGWGNNQDPGSWSGSGMNSLDHISEGLKTIYIHRLAEDKLPILSLRRLLL